MAFVERAPAPVPGGGCSPRRCRGGRALLASLVPYYLDRCRPARVPVRRRGRSCSACRSRARSVALVAVSLALVLCAVVARPAVRRGRRTEKQLGGIGSVVLLVMGMLGGCMFPRLLMPPFMQTIGLAVPHWLGARRLLRGARPRGHIDRRRRAVDRSAARVRRGVRRRSASRCSASSAEGRFPVRKLVTRKSRCRTSPRALTPRNFP